MVFDSTSREAMLDREIDKLMSKIVDGTASTEEKARYRDAVATRSSWMIGKSLKVRMAGRKRLAG